MSVHDTPGAGAARRETPVSLRARKGREPIVCLTAYTAPMARLLDAYADLLLVGDSLAMVVYGEETTLGVTLETMIAHGRAVVRGAARACVVVDMPFGAYQETPQQALRNGVRVMAATGCAAIKLEGGREMAETIRFLTERGLPVLAHVGLLPQQVHALGGFRTQGRSEAEAQRIVSDARAVAEAGAFAVVIEGVMEPLARAITEAVPVPTIGIGASAACDGQILVVDDMLGMTERVPRFVKRYADLGAQIASAASAFAAEVRARTFPATEHTYRPKEGA